MSFFRNQQLIYRILLFLLIFSFPFSSKLNIVDFGFFHFYFFRLVVVVAGLILFLNKDILLPVHGNNKFLVFFAGYLVVYGLISLFWVNNKLMALQQIFHLFWGIAALLTVYTLLNKTKGAMKVLIVAWAASFVVLVCFALFEVAAVIHFDGNFISVLEKFDSPRAVFSAPLATFTNPNDFAVFIVFTLGLFIADISKKSSKWMFPMFLLSLFLLRFVRSNIADFAVMFIVFVFGIFILAHRYWKINILSLSDVYSTNELKMTSLVRGAIVASIMAFVFIVAFNPMVILNRANNTNDYFVALPKNLTGAEMILRELSINEPIADESKAQTFATKSYNERLNLIISGFCFAKQSYFMGIGAGQFQEYILNGKSCVALEVASDPHNFIIEILSQYGLLPLLGLFAFLFLSFFYGLLQIFKEPQILTTPAIKFLIIIIPIYILLSCAPSSFISLSLNWIILAMIAHINNIVFHENVVQADLQIK